MIRWIATLIAALSFLGVITRMGVARLSTASGHPLEGYRALVPGEDVSALDDFSCVFYVTSYDSDANSKYCRITPDRAPHVRSIYVTLYGGTIRHVAFITQDLAFGQLVEQFQRPDVIVRQGTGYMACWESGLTAFAHAAAFFTYRARVDLVSFTEPDGRADISSGDLCVST